MIKLPSPKTKTKSKRVGRGYGTGRGGHTTGKGTKGQKARTGYKKPTPDFEGGQNPISKRVPKLRGTSRKGTSRRALFKSKQNRQVVNISRIESKFKTGSKITPQSLEDAGLISNPDHKILNVKVLFDKPIKGKFEFENVKMSKTAKDAVTKAGGKVE
jgi:large subunit ribosomal protein L15